MFTDLSLRLRVFLFFLFLASAGIAIVLGSLFVGFQRASSGDLAAGFTFAAILSGFGLLALTAGIWLLFDENVAKPIERIAATMRSRAHAGVTAMIDPNEARYLGDLAPAAEAVSDQLTDSTLEAARAVAEATAELAAEKEHLTALLTDLPVAMVLISPTHQIVLYDGQAASLLGQIHVPRLNASIFDYFVQDDMLGAYQKLRNGESNVRFEARGTLGNLSFDLRLKQLSHGAGYMVLIEGTHAEIAPDAARPLIYDFDLAAQDAERELEHRSLNGMNFVVFDTETTGLMPHKDEIVQIGAVRVVNGRIVPGELIDELVNPGRKIPPSTTKVHGISDEMVIDAPDPLTATGHFHHFARDSVIVAHNAPFDMAFMKRYGLQADLAWDHPIVDTVLLSAVLFGASETHTLDALCARLDVSIPAELRHTALGDAHATAEVLCKMLPMLTSRGINTFGELIQQTRRHGKLLKDLN